MACRSVKKICKSFNLSAELASVLGSLRMECISLTSMSAHAAAEANIKDLEAFIDGLSQVDSAGKLSEFTAL